MTTGVPIFGAADGPLIKEHGTAMRKDSVTWGLLVDVDFEVKTNEGKLAAQAGDFLAYDEKSGHVWPVAASYVAQNYVPAETPETSSEEDKALYGDLYKVLEALEHAAGYLSAIDVAKMELERRDDIDYRPLTQEVITAAQELRRKIRDTVGLLT